MNVRPIPGASVDARGRRNKGLLALILGVLLLAVTACGGGGSNSGSGSGDSKAKGSDTAETKQSQAVVTIAPKNGSKAVDTSGALKISAAKGKLTQVEVKDADGAKVSGAITGGGASWTPATHLAAATKYTVHAVAKDSDGRVAAEDSSFTTLTPKNTFIGDFTPRTAPRSASECRSRSTSPGASRTPTT